MRFVVLLMLVILLPLRGGMGNAMAATGPHHGNAAVHQQANDVAGAAQDCLGHPPTRAVSGTAPHVHDKTEPHLHASMTVTTVTMATTVNSAAVEDAACDTCSACQTCHAVGLVALDTAEQSLPVLHAQPASLSQHFASAPALRDQKPPIS